MTETPRPHARLGASTSPRWTKCPGCNSVIASLPVQPPPSKYALEGTTMHSAGEYGLRTGKVPRWDQYKYTVFENGSAVECELDQDCIDAVMFYIEVVTADQRKHGGKLFIEKQFTLERFRPDMWGTNDALLAYCDDGVLRVYDFKGGKGVAVEVTFNSQLMYYALGAVINLPDLHAREVELIIVQPRARHPEGPVRRWRISILDLYDFKVQLLEAAAATDEIGAPLHAGEWCKDTFCPATGWCKEYKAYAEKMMQLDFADPAPPPLPDPRTMKPAEIAALLPRFQVWRDWMGFVEACAHAMAERGMPVPGHKLVAKRGRRKWIGEDHEIMTALQGLGLKQRELFSSELKSPAQIEKMLPKDLRDRLSTLCEMVSSGSTLVPEDDPRPMVTPKGTLGFEMQQESGEPVATAALPPALRD